MNSIQCRQIGVDKNPRSFDAEPGYSADYKIRPTSNPSSIFAINLFVIVDFPFFILRHDVQGKFYLSLSPEDFVTDSVCGAFFYNTVCCIGSRFKSTIKSNTIVQYTIKAYFGKLSR